MNAWEERWDNLKKERNPSYLKNEQILKEQISMYENEKKKKISADLRDEISKFKESIMSYENELSELRGKNSVLENENSRLKNKVERMEGFMLSSIEDAEIEKQFEDYEKEISDYRAKCEIYLREKEKSIQDYSELFKKYSKLKNDNGKYISTISDLKLKLNNPSYLNVSKEANYI